MTDFDPFENTSCRHIRNQLSESLMEAIRAGTITPSRAVAEKLLPGCGQPAANYINNRLTRYQALLQQILSHGIPLRKTYLIARLLWDLGLFFEVHEWLEQGWVKAEGSEKPILQALIRAAGTYAFLETGKRERAEKMAAKAAAALKQYRREVSPELNVDRLIHCLEPLNPVPPTLGAGLRQ